MIQNNLIFGTWQFELKNFHENKIREIIKFAISKGIRWFDTALVYSDGLIEKVLSEYDNIKIITKIPAIRKPMVGDCDINELYSKTHILKCANESIKNLGRAPDVFLLHNWHESWNETRGIIEALDSLKETGKCKFVGISLPNNFQGELPNKLLEKIDYLMAPFNDENNWIIKKHELIKKYNIKILLRSLFKRGQNKPQKITDVYQTFLRAKEFSEYFVVGMTAKESVKDNLTVVSAFNKNIEILKEDDEYLKIRHLKSKYTISKSIYACLSKDKTNPLSCISKSNNGFNIDLWRGCSLGCAYCHVQENFDDLENWTNRYKPCRRNSFSAEEIVEALMDYSDFVMHESPISVCSSSTEPFLNDEIIESNLKIMEEFVNRGLRNPFWIITKVGAPNNKFAERFKKIIKNGNKIIVSICWTNNKKEIEPYSVDRFKNTEFFKKCGIDVNWYMRPLHEEWNAGDDNINFITKHVADKNIELQNIVVGGLRWTYGVEFGIKVSNNLPMPLLVKEDNVKTLSIEKMIYIKQKCLEYFKDIPVYFKSSCAMCHILKTADTNNVFQSEFCKISNCPKCQRNRCEGGKK